MDARHAQILKALSTPKTYKDLEEEFGVGYYTVRGHVQSLLDLGFVEELPWSKRGTNQKQFRSAIHNPEKEFTEEGCNTFKTPAGKEVTANSFFSVDINVWENMTRLPLVALSAPMWEYMAHVNPSEFFVNTEITTDKVVDKLAELHEFLGRLTSLVEQLISVGTWDPANPEINKILFHTTPEKLNWDQVRQAYKILGEIAREEW